MSALREAKRGAALQMKGKNVSDANMIRYVHQLFPRGSPAEQSVIKNIITSGAKSSSNPDKAQGEK